MPMSLIDSIRAKQAEIDATYRKNLEASGSHIGPAPTPTPTPSKPNSGVSFTPSYGSSGGSSTSVSATVSAVDKRRAEVAALILSPAPSVAAIQKRAQDEYVATGKWSQALTDAADAERKRLNALYPGGDRGTTDSQYFLPGAGSAQPNVDALGSLFDGMKGLFGSAAGAAGSAAGQAVSPGNNGTFMLLGVGALLFLLLGRRG